MNAHRLFDDLVPSSDQPQPQPGSQPFVHGPCNGCGQTDKGWTHHENFRFSIDTCNQCGRRVNVRHQFAYDEKGRRQP